VARRRRVTWSEPARDLLSEAVGFLAERSAAAAEHFLRDVDAAATSLEHFAERGRPVPEFGIVVVREIFVRSYRLMYWVRGDEVVIIALVHGRRALLS
jgi:toxin ParE1/3/4